MQLLATEVRHWLLKPHGVPFTTRCHQISIVLEYMDGGSLADVLSKVGCTSQWQGVPVMGSEKKGKC